ncbi:MAG: hypothetical protein HY328_17505, partial [Chloroflexi bacterium]|nr:hypothetical protein [Chloroflexota bacterium]
MLEIRLHTLLLILAGSIGLIALPFVVRSFSGSALPVHAAGQVLPTPTPVPTQGLSERARELAASLVLTPTPDALP